MRWLGQRSGGQGSSSPASSWVGTGARLSQAPRGLSNGPGQEKSWGRAEVSDTRSVSDNFSHPGRRPCLSEAIVFSLNGRLTAGQEGQQRRAGLRGLTMGSRLTRPQEGTGPDLSSREDKHIPRRPGRSLSDPGGRGMDHRNGNTGNTARLSRELQLE